MSIAVVKKVLLWGVVGAVVILLVIQAIPYGRDHGDPESRVEPPWDSPRTRELAAGACFDCHSNETTWPWYSNIAPVSWLVQRDVDEGRDRLNFSEWDKPQPAAGEVAEVVDEGEMPPIQYKLIHSDARLSSDERDELVQGLQATLGQAQSEREQPSAQD